VAGFAGVGELRWAEDQFGLGIHADRHTDDEIDAVGIDAASRHRRVIAGGRRIGRRAGVVPSIEGIRAGQCRQICGGPRLVHATKPGNEAGRDKCRHGRYGHDSHHQHRAGASLAAPPW